MQVFNRPVVLSDCVKNTLRNIQSGRGMAGILSTYRLGYVFTHSRQQ